MAKKVLVVDDEKLIVKGIRFALEQDGYEVKCAYEGPEAVDILRKEQFDIVLLDVMLPGIDGFEVCSQVREFSRVPIIMLTAKGEDIDKIMGLEYGADDYMTKPFNILELKARIKAVFRRTGTVEEASKPVMRDFGNLSVDTENRRLYVFDREVNLTAKEFELIEILTASPNKVFSRSQLLAMIWGEAYPGDERTVDVHVRRLREKIELNPSEPQYVHTRWGIGYFFKG